MKKMLLVLLISFNLVGYGKSINIDRLQEKNGVIYEKSQKTPYTGEVIRYYETDEILSKENYKNGKQDGGTIFYYETGEISGVVK